MSEKKRTLLKTTMAVTLLIFVSKAGGFLREIVMTAYYGASAAIRGIPCVWWDNHNFGNSGEAFGLLKRRSATWEYPVLLEAILAYSMK